jgi:sigma-E factor negative regulatory protein RseA
MSTNKRNEKISAFLDDDLHRDELMSFSLSAEPDDAQVAQRYQMIGDALRDELSESSFVDVSAAVREALADEELVFENQSAQQAKAAGLSSKDSSSSWFDLSSWFRPAAGMAVAASVAVVMVFSLSEQESGGIAPMASNPVIATPVAITPVAPVNSQGSYNQQPQVVELVADENTQLARPAVNQHRVNQHLEYATQGTLQGRLPYVRAVSFESESKR